MDKKAATFDLKKAILLMVASTLSLSVMAVFVKLASRHSNNDMIIFVRFAISSVYIFLLLGVSAAKGNKVVFKTKKIHLHLARTLASFLAILFFYFSLRYISLIDGNLLLITSPLFVPIIIFGFFRVRTNVKCWLAIMLGFIGIILVIKPGYELFHPSSIIALFSGICSAVSFILLRQLHKYDDTFRCMLYYFPLAFLFSCPLAITHWQTPDWTTLAILTAVGIFGTSYQEFLIRASRYAPAKITSSLMYLSIIFSCLLGWLIFGEIPSIASWIGIILVVIGSIGTIKYTDRAE